MQDPSTVETRTADVLLEHLQRLLNYVSRRVRYYEALGDLQPEDLPPEEIVDRVYLEAGEQLRGRTPAETTYRWLRGLAERILAREIRRTRAARAREAAPAVALARRLPEILPDPRAPLPEDVAEAAELQRALARLVGELPDALREPFLLVITDGYSVREVAALEGLPPGEIARRVMLATYLLRDRLAEEYGVEEPPPVEEIFTLVEQLRPSPTVAAHARARLGASPPPTPPAAA